MNRALTFLRRSSEPRRSAAGGRRAFTLLEVLVALAIFAMGFIVILAAYANILTSYEGIRRDREGDEDAKFARAALLAQPDLQKAQDGDEFESTGGRHVRWTSVIEPSETIADLFSVTFTCEVSDPKQATPEKFEQAFMVVRPTWSDAIERGKLLQATKDRIAELQGKQPNGFIAASPVPANEGGGAGRGGGFGGGGGGRGPQGPGGFGGGGRGGRNGGGPGLGGGNGNGGGRDGQPAGGNFQRGGGPGGAGGGGTAPRGGGGAGGGGAARGTNQAPGNAAPVRGGGR